MSHALATDSPVTIAGFDAFLDRQGDDALWELVAGRIVAVTNSTERHEQLVANLGAPLKLAMDAQNCRTYFGGMRIQRSDDARGLDKPRPDLLVRCGPLSGRTYVTDPMLVVEVLSPSTIDNDRGEKLRFYQRLPTMRHIVFVYQDQMRAEHYCRRDTGWHMESLTKAEDRLVLEAVRFEITLSAIYAGTDVTVAPPPGA